MILFFGGILYPNKATHPAKGTASNGTWENTTPIDLEIKIKPLPEKSPNRTKNVSTRTEDL